MILIFGNLKYDPDPLVRVGFMRSADRVLSNSEKESEDYSVVISSVIEYIMGIDMLTNWQNSHTDFSTLIVKSTVVEKATWKPLGLAQHHLAKIVNEKQSNIPRGITRLVPVQVGLIYIHS